MVRRTSRKITPIVFFVLVFLSLSIVPWGMVYRFRVMLFTWMGSVLDSTGIYTEYIDRETRLEQDNQRLLFLLKQSEAEEFSLKKELSFYRKLKESIDDNIYISARVIYYDPSGTQSRVLINKGMKDGIEINDLVLSEGYVLGRVWFVFEHTAEVMLLNDALSVFPVSIGKKQLSGILKGTGKGRLLRIEYIDNQPENLLMTGDIVVTSEYTRPNGSVLPAHKPIGVIANNPKEDTQSYNQYLIIKVQPYVNLLSLRHVSIIKTHSPTTVQSHELK